MGININYSQELLDEFCKKHGILKLSFFGSITRGDFTRESDLDVLVEFKKHCIPGFIRLASMEEELSQLFGGRKVDLNTPNSLSPHFRKDVIASCKVQYDQAR